MSIDNRYIQPTHPNQPFRIGYRIVGPGQPVFIIAEAGVNHDGSLDDALEMVDVAAGAGADAVKFQVFRADDLVTASASTATYQKAATGNESQHDMLRRLELSPSDFGKIQEYCRSKKIAFLATPFSPNDAQVLLDLDVTAFKVASTDLDNRLLLAKIAASDKPAILSTGASDTDEIRRAVEYIHSTHLASRFILLHCVSSYPTRWEDANLRAIATLQEMFQCPTGFSDHTQQIETGALAAAAGACVLEKHFTLDSARPGPDHAMSLEPDQLAEYVQRVRQAEVALGKGNPDYCEAEAEVRNIARKSLVAARPLQAGTVLTTRNIVAKRPGGGISPDRIEEVLGKTLSVNLPEDAVLTWEVLS